MSGTVLTDGINVLSDAEEVVKPVAAPKSVEEKPVAPVTQPADEEDEFDPYDHTIVQVKDFVEKHPDLREEVLASEKAGKNRVTLMEWLQSSDTA